MLYFCNLNILKETARHVDLFRKNKKIFYLYLQKKFIRKWTVNTLIKSLLDEIEADCTFSLYFNIFTDLIFKIPLFLLQHFAVENID